VGFIELAKDLNIFSFIYLIASEVKYCTCPVNQIPIVQPSYFTRNHILVTNSHFTPELLICASGDLTMSTLAHTARLLDCQRPTFVVNMKISFISLFFVLG